MLFSRLAVRAGANVAVIHQSQIGSGVNIHEHVSFLELPTQFFHSFAARRPVFVLDIMTCPQKLYILEPAPKTVHTGTSLTERYRSDASDTHATLPWTHLPRHRRRLFCLHTLLFLSGPVARCTSSAGRPGLHREKQPDNRRPLTWKCNQLGLLDQFAELRHLARFSHCR